jgi:hypothetical protein
MKRLMTIALVLLVGLTVCAQGKWRVSHRQADELIEQEERDVYIYDVEGVGRVVVWDWKKPDFMLITEEGFFHQQSLVGVGLCVPIKVGFYDNGGTLKKKFDIIMFGEDNSRMKSIVTGGWYRAGRGNIRKTLAQMKSGDGYVRIVADLANRSPFDIKITPYQQ